MRHEGSKAVYVGNLPTDVREDEVEGLFEKYGRIKTIDLKIPPRPPPFAFLEFEHSADAADAVKGRDGYEFHGVRLRVELARGGNQGGRGSSDFGGRGRDDRGGRDSYSDRGRYDDRGGRDSYSRDSYRDSYRDRDDGGRRARDRALHPPPTSFNKGTGYKVIVTGLPKSCSWQDLKDHFRQVVKPEYTNVYKDGDGVMGVVEFAAREDMALAIRKLDDSEFKNPFEKAYITLREEGGGGGGRGGRSRSRSRGRRSRSSSRGRRSKSRSRSRSKSRSKSPRSKSRSKSPRSKSPRSKSRSKSRSRSPASRSRSPSPKKGARGRSKSRSASPMSN